MIAVGKGSSLFCGSSTSPKQLESSFSRIIGYEHIFEVVRPFQDKKIKESIIDKYQQEHPSGRKEKAELAVLEPVKSRAEEARTIDKCRNC